MTFATFLIALGAALGLGLLIGLERQFGQHPAGLRTNALVCGGAALYVLLARSFDSGSDTARVAAQIVSGIGFLGGGVILREGLTVRGLTTAATLWCSAAVGALCGADLPVQAGIATGAILATNCLLNPVSRWIDRKAAKRAFHRHQLPPESRLCHGRRTPHPPHACPADRRPTRHDPARDRHPFDGPVPTAGWSWPTWKCTSATSMSCKISSRSSTPIPARLRQAGSGNRKGKFP